MLRPPARRRKAGTRSSPTTLEARARNKVGAIGAAAAEGVASATQLREQVPCARPVRSTRPRSDWLRRSSFQRRWARSRIADRFSAEKLTAGFPWKSGSPALEMQRPDAISWGLGAVCGAFFRRELGKNSLRSFRREPGGFREEHCAAHGRAVRLSLLARVSKPRTAFLLQPCPSQIQCSQNQELSYARMASKPQGRAISPRGCCPQQLCSSGPGSPKNTTTVALELCLLPED